MASNDTCMFDFEPAKTEYVTAEAAAAAWSARQEAAGTSEATAPASDVPLVVHRGRCHCGAVRFEVDAPADIIAYDCNCSICRMKRNTHFVVPASRFRFRAPLSSDSSSTAKDSSSSSSSSNSDKSNPWSQLTTYAFNTGVAKHHFCKTCGVVPFYQARSNPDGFAITVHCLEPGTVRQDYAEFGNILNLAMVTRDDRDNYVVVAAWLDAHDQLIQELLGSPDVNITPRRRYSTTGRSGSVHFTADDGGRVFVCITKEGYPSRVAHMCLEEMQDHVLLSPQNNASLVATRPHELSDAMLPILDDLVDKFDDPGQADALTSVNRKIEVTTNTMHDNISLLLENDSELEEIEGKANNMTDQADKFRNSSKSLRDKMWWQMCKMRICYALVALSLLAVIIVPIVVMSQPSGDSNSGHSSETIVIYGRGDDDDKYRKKTHAPEYRGPPDAADSVY